MHKFTFAGTIQEFQEYLGKLVDKYGKGCTLKEVLECGC